MIKYFDSLVVKGDIGCAKRSTGGDKGLANHPRSDRAVRSVLGRSPNLLKVYNFHLSFF
ncbi:MAG: hypothetical protein KME57_01130 [Scytonema hyalinum WJT4-NPBG1]|nr:hypothetical protein [Scytonema hyalinum WJT4-NPBG1]